MSPQKLRQLQQSLEFYRDLGIKQIYRRVSPATTPPETRPMPAAIELPLRIHSAWRAKVVAAFDLSRAQGFYQPNPGAAISIEQITLKAPTENSKGVRLGSFVLIRDVIDEELEQAFSGKKSAQAALDAAVERGNRLLRQFERANQ